MNSAISSRCMTTFYFIVRPRSIRRLNFDLKFSAVQIYNTLEIIDEHIINRLENILHIKDERILEDQSEDHNRYIYFHPQKI